MHYVSIKAWKECYYYIICYYSALCLLDSTHVTGGATNGLPRLITKGGTTLSVTPDDYQKTISRFPVYDYKNTELLIDTPSYLSSATHVISQ